MYRLGRICFAALMMEVILVDAQTPAGSSSTTNAVPALTTDQQEQIQIDLANGFYSRDFFDLAVAEYQKYLDWFPGGASVEEARYRIADCLRGQGKIDASRAQYEALQKAFPNGKYFARASFRVGEMDWNAGRFANAFVHFESAAEKAESTSTRLSARFYQARALIQLKKASEAGPVLMELARIEKANPYRGFALLELARLAEASGREEEARGFYKQVTETDASPLLRAEAGIKAGSIEMKIRHWPAAAAFFESVRKLEVPAEWVELASANAVRAYYQNNQYDLALKLLESSKASFPPNAQAEMSLLHGHALRLLKKYREAVAQYDVFLKTHAGHAAQESAAYERLICLYAVNAEAWDGEAAGFIKTYPQAKSAAQVLYLQADRAFKRKDYVFAAAAYASIPLSGERTIDPSKIPEVMYRRGFSLAQGGRGTEAAAVFSDFVQRFPEHAYAPNALFQRAVSEQGLGKLDVALASYREIIERYPRATERETSLYRTALLQGELRRYSAMRETFQKLARDYPKNAFINDSTYWIGWSLFEEKKYAEALPHLLKAREVKPAEYGAESTSRILLCQYYLKRRVPLAKEILALPEKSSPLAPEIYEWVARQSAHDGDPAMAEKFFRKLVAHPDAEAWKQSARWGMAVNLSAQSKWSEAVEVWEAYQKDYPTPIEIVSTRLELIRGYAAIKNYVHAQELAEDVMRLQPEGKNNAHARFQLAEVLNEQKKYDEAAKYYLSVAVLYEDPEMTPRSLSKAIEAFGIVGQTNEVERLSNELKTKYPDFKP